MKLKYIALSVLLVVAAINFTRTTLEIIKSSKRLDTIKGDITLLEQEKTALEQSIDYKKSNSFIEKTARDALNMAKPGESVYVISGLSSTDQAQKESGSAVILTSSKGKTTVRTPAGNGDNLKLWFKLLF